MTPERWSFRTRFILAGVSGGLLFLAFPPTDQGWVAVFALIPFFLALRGASRRGGALLGAIFAAAFFTSLLFWISLFGFLALAVLMLGHMAYFAVFGFIAAGTSRARGASGRLLGWPLAWTGLEMMRGRWPLGGMTWGDIGYSQQGGTMLPLARLGGVFLLGMVIVAVNALLAEGLVTLRRRVPLGAAAIGLVLLPGFAPLGLAGPKTGELDVAAVQGNVPREAFRGFGRGRVGPEDAEIVGNHLEVTRRLSNDDPPDLIVWPENAFDRDPRREPALFEEVAEVSRAIGAPMILPSILEVDEGFTNSALLLETDGALVDRYDKVHLVPFGEYVPWGFARDLVPALEAEVAVDGIPGTAVRPLQVRGRAIGTLICFESTYADLAREMVRRGAEVIVVVTNNASFQETPASDQHVAMSRMRAVEHGRAVVHAAISGVSAIILPDGTITQRSLLFEQALLRESVPLTQGLTPYARYGGGIQIAMGIGAALAAGVAALARRREDA